MPTNTIRLVLVSFHDMEITGSTRPLFLVRMAEMAVTYNDYETEIALPARAGDAKLSDLMNTLYSRYPGMKIVFSKTSEATEPKLVEVRHGFDTTRVMLISAQVLEILNDWWPSKTT